MVVEHDNGEQSVMRGIRYDDYMDMAWRLSLFESMMPRIRTFIDLFLEPSLCHPQV